jgi:hypothetical protein
MTWDLLGRVLLALAHLHTLDPPIAVHSLCVFFSLANDNAHVVQTCLRSYASLTVGAWLLACHNIP